MNQLVSFGANNDSFLKDLFRSKRWKKCFMVTGKKSFETSGAKDFINDSIKENVISIGQFSDFENNPNIIDLQEGLKKIREYKPDVIVAIGGGSVIDMGKLLRFFYAHDGEILSGSYTLNNNNIPLIAVPTTAGTGSEATHFAVLYKDGIKHSVEHKNVLPDVAFVYPPFTYNNSAYLTACTGFDALAQSIEAFWNRNATKESDEYAKKAIKLIYPNIVLAVNSPSNVIRDKMALGSYLAGKAINITKTTAPHAFSYGLTSLYGYPHGHAVAICFPEIMKLNLKNEWRCNFKKKELINYLGFDNEEASIRDIESLIEKINLQKKSGYYDINKLSQTVNASRLSNNPIIISDETIPEIYSKLNI